MGVAGASSRSDISREGGVKLTIHDAAYNIGASCSPEAFLVGVTGEMDVRRFERVFCVRAGAGGGGSLSAYLYRCGVVLMMLLVCLIWTEVVVSMRTSWQPCY